MRSNQPRFRASPGVPWQSPATRREADRQRVCAYEADSQPARGDEHRPSAPTRWTRARRQLVPLDPNARGRERRERGRVAPCVQQRRDLRSGAGRRQLAKQGRPQFRDAGAVVYALARGGHVKRERPVACQINPRLRRSFTGTAGTRPGCADSITDRRGTASAHLRLRSHRPAVTVRRGRWRCLSCLFGGCWWVSQSVDRCRARACAVRQSRTR